MNNTKSERDAVALRVDAGDPSVEYRGQTITVDDLRPNKWVYRIDGNEFESLEAVLDDVDDRLPLIAGSSFSEDS